MNWKAIIFHYKLHHILPWLFIAIAWYYLRYDDYSTVKKALEVTVIKIVDLAIMVYVANYVLVPYLLYRKKYLLFALAFIAMILISSISKMYILGRLLNNPELLSLGGNLKARIYDNVIPHFFLVIAGVSIKLLLDYTRIQKRLAEVAKEKAEAELNFLRSQLNPHFLFNSLNSVYFLIDKQNDEARKALHKFSEMLRYQLYEMKDEKITIEKEISFIRDYIDLQQLRRYGQCKVVMNVDDSVKDFHIQPLLLIPFVENSFKHLSHYNNGKANEIDIDIARRKQEVEFSIKNTTEQSNKVERSSNGGIGLGNVKRRLELLYPQKHMLHIYEDDGWFNVQLKVKIEQ
ncbi:MAG: sensor histidine kinase [Flavisolibacter sp.]